MEDTGQMIPLTDFAKAMRSRAGDSFAARVSAFESEFGKADDDTLAVLAQAAYYCWGNCHYRDNLLQLCIAICTGRPTSMYLHGQVSPQRWTELNTYVVAVQLWLSPNGSGIPDDVDTGAVSTIAGWLGDRSNAKRVLAALFLNELVANLVIMNLSKLGSAHYADPDEYHDFTHWYMRSGGSFLGRGRKEFTDHCVRETSAEAQCNGDVGEIIANIVKAKPHSCMHRFARHLDIQLTSIGALKWRGNLPQCKVLSKESWIHFIEQDCGVRSWLAGNDATNDYAVTVHTALGVPTAQKRAVVSDFLCAQDRGDVFAGGWIGEQSEARGRNASHWSGQDVNS